MKYTEKGAVVSKNGRYRYRLWRRQIEVVEPTGSEGTLVFIMNNPSTADGEYDDPTIRRCVGFAYRWGFYMVEVVNLFAWRATNPNHLGIAHDCGRDIVGPRNDAHVRQVTEDAALIVVAWGDGNRWYVREQRVAQVMDILRDKNVMALGVTKKDGSPRHPLYVRGDVELQRWR